MVVPLPVPVPEPVPVPVPEPVPLLRPFFDLPVPVVPEWSAPEALDPVAFASDEPPL